MGQICKYDELRLKTERQLHESIDRALEEGIREARQALACETWTLAQAHYLRARRSRATASHLIRLVDQVSVSWAAILNQLREMIDGLSVLAAKPTPTSETVASLARALWDARGRPEGSPNDDWFRAERSLKSQRSEQTVCC